MSCCSCCSLLCSALLQHALHPRICHSADCASSLAVLSVSKCPSLSGNLSPSKQPAFASQAPSRPLYVWVALCFSAQNLSVRSTPTTSNCTSTRIHSLKPPSRYSRRRQEARLFHPIPEHASTGYTIHQSIVLALSLFPSLPTSHYHASP